MAYCKAALVLLFAAAALESLLVTARLSADITPPNATGSGNDWCQQLKPCDKPKTSSAEIESIFGLGLLSKASGGTAQYQYESVTPAAAVDWRTVLTNWTVRDQGTCGSCYAFAAAGALEAILAIDREANVTSELSEAELVDCLPSSDYGCDSNNDCNGCNGGDPSTALEYALAQQGLPSAAAYPYGALISSDAAGTCLNVSVEEGTSFVSVQRVPTTTKALKQAVTMQPVIVGVDASDWSYYYSQQGIYDGDCTANTLNHALLVVGYDQMSTGQEYWILRNQWSAAWGAEGYIYLPISSSDDDTGGACGLLGSKNDFPPVFPSMSSGAIALQSLSVLCFIAAFFVLFLST